MYLRVNVIEYLTQQSYTEIGEFKSLYYDVDTKCAVISLKSLNDLYLPVRDMDDYDKLDFLIYRVLEQGKTAATLGLVCVDIPDDTFDSVQDWDVFNDEVLKLSNPVWDNNPILSCDITIQHKTADAEIGG